MDGRPFGGHLHGRGGVCFEAGKLRKGECDAKENTSFEMRRVEELIPSRQMRAMDSELIDPVI